MKKYRIAESGTTEIDRLIKELRIACAGLREPVVTAMSRRDRDPFKVLIATLLSLRTRDEQTHEAAQRLFGLASTPSKMLGLSAGTIEQAIYPVGFYRVKAARILEVCRILVDSFDSEVPDDLDRLLALPGVGRKTANLVMTRGFGLPGICVDTHVHRISNRLGYVSTRNPDRTEMVLRKKLPQKYWIEFNDLLVAYGQSICTPISPWCSICTLADRCPRVGVDRHR